MWDKKKYYREYYQKNKKKYIKYIKKYQQSDKGKKKIKEWAEKYHKTTRYKELSKKYRLKNRQSPEWVIKERLRVYQIKVLKQANNLQARRLINNNRILNYLKPIPKDLSNHEIDHKNPLSKFDLTKDEEVKKAFLPSNHQLVLKWENQMKAGKTDKQFRDEMKESIERIKNF